ncbi:uncharacterized protein LOC135400977 [Ornithodoros turicata]|uniref:uncharacterized protein LOC135400977 n=1 Tax=Ornithodoros turicata TaxID=34597 RepID=UPI00313A234F
MAYINIADWTPEHVADWLRGLDDIIIPYVHFFLNNDIDGHHLLTLGPDDLTSLNITKIGHQELILEAVDHLRQLHYRLLTENLQSLSLKLGCRARSLYNDIKRITPPDQDNVPKISTSILADVSEVLVAVKAFVSWLDRPPFEGQERYFNIRKTVLQLGIELASTAQRDHFADKPFAVIQGSCMNLADLCDMIIQECNDSLIIQPASLDVATVKKKSEEEWGMQIHSSYSGIHVVGGVKFQSPCHRCGKVDVGDEIIQINYQTVIGWQPKHLVYMLQEHPAEILLTLKKRPRHTNILGQVIVLRPYRIPLKKTTYGKARKWSENGVPQVSIEEVFPQKAQQDSSSPRALRDVEDDDSAFLPDEAATASAASNTSTSSVVPSIRAQVFPPRSRATIHRRATVSGASPTVTKAPVSIVDLVAGGVPSILGGNKKKDAVIRSVSHDPNKHMPGKLSSVDDDGVVDPPPPENTKPSEPPPRRSPMLNRWKEVDKDDPDDPPPEKMRTSSDSSVVPLAAKMASHLPNVGLPRRDSSKCSPSRASLSKRVSLTGSSADPGLPEKPVQSTEKKVEAASTKDRKIFAPSMSKLSPMATLKVPKIEDLKKGCSQDKLSKEKQRNPMLERSSQSLDIPPKAGQNSKDSPKKSSQSPLLKKRECVSKRLAHRSTPCKELGMGDCEGWLCKRKEQKAFLMKLLWVKRWVLLKGHYLYVYKSKEDSKAECFIYLPGFVVTPAVECRSIKCAFKLYYSGTTFYFAAESQTDMMRWITGLGIACKALKSPSNNSVIDKVNEPESPYFSETDDDSELDGCARKAIAALPVSGDRLKSSDVPKQSPKPMPRTIFLRSTIPVSQCPDSSASINSATLFSGLASRDSNTRAPRNASLPRDRISAVQNGAGNCVVSSALPKELSQPCSDMPVPTQRFSGHWDSEDSRQNPAKRDIMSHRLNPPPSHYVNVSFVQKNAKPQKAIHSQSLHRDVSGQSETITARPPVCPSLRYVTQEDAPPPATRQPPLQQPSAILHGNAAVPATEPTQGHKQETLLDREYNRVFRKSPSSSSSPDPTHSDSSAPSPSPSPYGPLSAPARCASSRAIKDLYTNRRNSWKGSQQELITAQYSPESPSLHEAQVHGCPPQKPDILCHRIGVPESSNSGFMPASFRDAIFPRRASQDSKNAPQVENKGKTMPPAVRLSTQSPVAVEPPPKSPIRFFHSPKFLKKFASSTREGLSNILRSPRLERKKVVPERDAYGSPKLSRSSGVRLLKSTSASSAPLDLKDDMLHSPPTKSGSSSSLNSSTSAGSFVTSSSSCYAELHGAPGTPETHRSRPTMGVSMLRGMRRTSPSVTGSEERSFSPSSLSSASGAQWADGSVFGDDPITPDAIGSGSERD